MTLNEKRDALDRFCDGRMCGECPLNGKVETECDFRFFSAKTIDDLYNTAFPDADNGTNNGIDAKDEHLAMVAEIIAKECDKAVENYKAALLKKIFPYDAVDKKQYSINAYAVWQAINETEVHHD